MLAGLVILMLFRVVSGVILCWRGCSRLFPAAFLNLRMSPVRMLQCSEDQGLQ